MTFPDRQISQRSAETGASVALVSDAMEVRHALEELLDQLGPLQMAEEELGSVELVVAEALNNIVEHAYLGRDDGRIELNWVLSGNGLHIRITDNGVPMPEGRIPLHPDQSPKDHAALVPEGCFGWFLIGGLAHNIVYRRDRGRNVLSFRLAVALD